MEQNIEPKVETKSNRRQISIILGIILGVLVVAAAAFIGGQLLNGSGSPFGFLPFGNQGGMVSMSIEFKPAPELPTTQPEAVGNFVERQDNSIFIQEFSMDSGAQGGVVVSSSSGSVSGSDGDPSSVQIVGGNSNNGPKVEIVVTGETLIYKDVTSMSPNTDGGTQIIQQAVEPGSLDEMSTQTMVQVWGRKVGDRIIADVIFFSAPGFFIGTVK